MSQKVFLLEFVENDEAENGSTEKICSIEYRASLEESIYCRIKKIKSQVSALKIT
jgi:hypothetical protein